MAIVYLYREPDDNTIPDPTQLANDRVRLYTASLTQNAEEGSIGTSTILIDDPDGDLDIVGHRIMAVKEEDVTGDEPFIYLGYIAERKVRRGPFRNATGRQWEVQVVDLNTILERRIMTGSDANRPAETDVQRVQWLEATNEGHIINDTRYLFGGSPAISMDAVDYRGQSFKSVLDDCAQASGKNYYLTHFADTGTSSKYPWGVISLWYGRSSRSEYVSTIALSNVLTDVDMSTTFAISEDSELTRDPSRVYSGIYGIYDGGTTYVQKSTTASLFARRDAVSPMENVKTNSRATARATRMLDDISTEEDVITTTVHKVPSAQVNDLRPGMLVPVRAIHFPGYEDPQYMRVLNRTVIQESETTYAWRMELSGIGESVPTVNEVFYINVVPYGSHSSASAIEASDDGVAWTPIIPDLTAGSIATNLWSISAPDRNHRYWSLTFIANVGGGFFGGYDMNAFRLLDAAGVDALGTAGTNPGFGPAIPWALASPTAYVGPNVPYVAISNGIRAQLYGTYLGVDFSGTYPGPVNGDFTVDASDDSHFGLEPLVVSAGPIEARWTWDLGA